MQFGQVIRMAVTDMKFDWMAVFCAWLLAAVPSILSDLYMDEREGIQLVGLVSLFLIAFQVILTRRSLVRRNLLTIRHDPPRGFAPRAIGQNILWALAIVAGLIALIVPGLILLVRWALCLPVLISEDVSVIESFKKSWTLTKGHFAKIAALFAISCVPAILAILLLIWSEVVMAINATTWSIAANALIATSQMVWWFVQIEIYSQLYKSPSQLA
jgi:hypothetical protein